MDAANMKNALAELGRKRHQFAGWYALRLAMTKRAPFVRIGEFLYSKVEPDVRKSGEKLFDYVDPRNRQVQIEMEMACTSHLKESGAWLQPRFRAIHFGETDFTVEASVVIPVKN